MKFNFLIRKMEVADVSEILVYIYHTKQRRIRKLLNKMFIMLESYLNAVREISKNLPPRSPNFKQLGFHVYRAETQSYVLTLF
jgi:hypothetical protein